MTDDNSLFYRMLGAKGYPGPIADAAKKIAEIKAIKENYDALVNGVKREPEELPLTEQDKQFLSDLKVTA